MPVNTTLNFRFHKYPFVLITANLCLGIIAGFIWKEWADLFYILFLVVLASTIILSIKGLLKNWLIYAFVFIGFVCIGAMHMHEKETLGKKHALNDLYNKGDAVVVRLRDVGNSNKEWKKMTGTIQEIVRRGGRTNYTVNEPIVLYVKSTNFGCESGDEILIISELMPIANANNPGEFDAENYWSKQGYSFMTFVGEDQYTVINRFEQGWINRSLNSMRAYLKSTLEQNLKGKELGIALALILGDKSNLDVETRNSFTNTGAMHILAVSGLHIGIIMQILMVIMGFFTSVLSRKNAVFIVVIIMWIYAVITGLSPSVLRAVFMFTFLAMAQFSGKNYNSINILFFTAFVLLLINPFTLYDIGFQLSFLAMVGIFLFYKPIEQIMYIENKWLRKVWQGTAIGFAAQLMTTPLSLYYFHQFPNYFVLTNIGLMASSGLILGLGLFIFAIGWWKVLARFTGVILSFIIFISLAFIEWVEGLPGAVAYGFDVSIVMVLAITAIILMAFLYAKKPAQMFAVLGFGLLVLIVLVSKRFDNNKVNELCVFNARQLIVTIRKKDQIYCFYKADKEDFGKVKFVLEAYQKLHPAKITYFPLNKSNWTLKSDHTLISTEQVKNIFTISINKEIFSINTFDKEYEQVRVNGQNTTTIGMPWVNSKVDHSLKDGAFRRRI